MSFIDSQAKIGRPFRSPDSSLDLDAKPTATYFHKESSSIHFEIKNGKLLVDFTETITRKVRIRKQDALRFATWIIANILKLRG